MYPVYPVIFVDAIHDKIRDGQVANRPIYVALAVTCRAAGTSSVSGPLTGGGIAPPAPSHHR